MPSLQYRIVLTPRSTKRSRDIARTPVYCLTGYPILPFMKYETLLIEGENDAG